MLYLLVFNSAIRNGTELQGLFCGGMHTLESAWLVKTRLFRKAVYNV